MSLSLSHQAVWCREPCLSFSSFLLPVAHEMWVPPIPLPMPWASQHTAGQTQSSGRGCWGAPSIPSTQVLAPRSCCCHLLPFVLCHGSEDKPARGQPCLDPCKHPRDSIHPRARSAPGSSLPLPVHVSSISETAASPVSHLWVSLQQCTDLASSDVRTARGIFPAFSLEISLFLAGGSFLWPQQTTDC